MKQTTPLSFNHELTFATTRRKFRGRWLLLALLIPLLAGAAVYTYTRLVALHPPAPATALSALQLPTAAALEESSGNKVNVVVRPNDTIERIFQQLKLSAADLNTVLNLPGVGASFKQLKAGEKMTVVHNGGALHAINRRISETEVLSVTRSKNGFAAERVVTLN